MRFMLYTFKSVYIFGKLLKVVDGFLRSFIEGYDDLFVMELIDDYEVMIKSLNWLVSVLKLNAIR